MKILLLCRYGDHQAEALADELARQLRSNGSHPAIHSRNLLKDKRDVFDLRERPDLVIVIGGDGTILLAIQRMPCQVPMVGINYGKVGFLADIEPDDLLKLFSSLIQPLRVEPRMRIDFLLNGEYAGTALNEALIVTERPAKMLKFLIHIDGIIAEKFRADGLIISTPTGSTAYAMSAGGPIVDPRVEEFLLVPLAPFMLSNRPHLIDSSRTVSVTLDAAKGAKLVIDGQIEIHMGTDSVVEMIKSKEPALFLDVGLNFFEKINRKLRHI